MVPEGAAPQLPPTMPELEELELLEDELDELELDELELLEEELELLDELLEDELELDDEVEPLPPPVSRESQLMGWSEISISSIHTSALLLLKLCQPKKA